MASIQERKNKDGTISYVVVFYHEGSYKKVFLDSSYKRRDAERAKLALEGWSVAQKHGESLDRATREYFDSAPPDLLKRFGAIGVVEAKQSLPVADVWEKYLEFSRSVVKPGTLVHRETVFARFRAYFGSGVRFESLTPETLQEFRDELVKHYAPVTISKTVADLRGFANWAIQRGYATSNPFLEIARGATTNHARDYQVPTSYTERILNACPTQTWRTLYCLWRYAGLRQQEPMTLTRESVRLGEGKLIVHSTKTERYGDRNGYRDVPIVPTLARELEAQLKTLPSTEHYLIYEHRRHSFDSGFRRILFSAGLPKWPKTFQNLRSSCENDWIAQGIPSHVVASWLGHSVKTQSEYYLRVLPEYFSRVTGM